MKLYYAICAFIATASLLVLAVDSWAPESSNIPDFSGIAAYSTAIVQTISDRDPDFRDRLLTKLRMGKP